MNMRQENYEESPDTKSVLENHKEKESEKSQSMLLHLKEMMDVHKDVSLPEILKEKQRISERIEDFDIDDIRNLGNFGKSYYGTFIGKDKLV